jgi:uncharacterized protein (TIGR02284 family)
MFPDTGLTRFAKRRKSWQPQPQAFKTRYSRQRAGFAAALTNVMQEMGFTPATHGSVSGAMHRGWINLMKVTPGDNEHAVLAACERGEDAAVEHYGEAMGALLPDGIVELVSTQYQAVKATHDRIRSLRDAAQKD